MRSASLPFGRPTPPHYFTSHSVHSSNRYPLWLLHVVYAPNTFIFYNPVEVRNSFIFSASTGFFSSFFRSFFSLLFHRHQLWLFTFKSGWNIERKHTIMPIVWLAIGCRWKSSIQKRQDDDDDDVGKIAIEWMLRWKW